MAATETTRPDSGSDSIGGTPRADLETRLETALKSLPGLDPVTVETIIRIAVFHTVAPGSVLFKEGTVDNTLFAVLEGHLIVTRRALRSELPLGVVKAGELLGDVSFLDASSRQATARADKETVVVARIDPMDLILLPDGDRHYDALRTALVVPITRAFRQQSKSLVVAMEEKQNFSGFFVYMIAILYGCMLIYFLVAERFVEDTTTNLFAWQSAAVLVIPSLFVVYRLGLDRADLGLLRSDFWRSAKAGMLWGGIVATAITGAFFAARALGLIPDFERAQAFEMIDMALYLPHTFVQEFVARGIIQNGYQRFFNDETGYRSVVFASLVFGVAHIPLGFLAVAITFIGGIVFGLFFLRYRNIVGVTILHYCLGASAIALGFI